MTLVPAAFFVFFEIGLRVFGFGYPTGFFVKAPGRDTLVTNQRFGWRFFPPAIARAPAVDEFPASKGEKEYRIFVLGGSAAMGTPDEAFGFGRFLEVMLRERFPGIDFRVVNGAMTAINSNVVLPIARDCAHQAPDLFVIYMGNNEVVGPYGAGTVFQSFSPRLSTIRASIFVRATRIGQLISALAGREGDETEWRGMEMFLGQQVPADDPRLEKVYDHFRGNLQDICRVARDSEARVVVCTVGTNLKDCAPFAAVHRSDLTGASLKEWDAAFAAGEEWMAAGDFEEARNRFLDAIRIDGDHANVHFRLAQCLEELAEYELAKEHYVLARDLDTQRFRADSRINEIIRQIPKEAHDDGISLLDVERAIEESDSTLHGIPGNELFFEHVHFRPEGNYEVARLVFERVAAMLPEWVREEGSAKAGVASFDECCQSLPLTELDRFQMELAMSGMTERPPFTNQVDYDTQRDRWRQAVAEARARAITPAALDEAQRWYAVAVEQRPEDVETRRHFAQLLSERGDHDEAVSQWESLLDRFPDKATWRLELGSALRAQGKLDEAIAEYEDALRTSQWVAGNAHYRIGLVRLQLGELEEATNEFRTALAIGPESPLIHNNLGAALLKQEKLEDAAGCFRRAIELAPDHAGAYNNLGVILERQGDVDGAVKCFGDALRFEPGNVDATCNLAAALVRQDRPQDAIDAYRRAIRVSPQNANVHFRLALLLAGQRQIAEAVEEYQRVVEIDPGNLDARCQLAGGLAVLKRPGEAIEQYREALRQRPDWLPAMNGLALIEATAADPEHRNPAEAVRLMERACSQTGERDASLLDTMAAAYAAAGRFDDAVATAGKALSLAEAEGKKRLAMTIRERLDLYRQRRALEAI